MKRILSLAWWRHLAYLMAETYGRFPEIPRRTANASEMASLKFVPGVSVVALDVWTDSRKPCQQHCWHSARAGIVHRSAMEFKGSKHDDYVCCACTHGLCRTGPGLKSFLDQQDVDARICRK